MVYAVALTMKALELIPVVSLAIWTGVSTSFAAAAPQATQPFEIQAVRTAKPPVVDGTIGDEEWQSASVARNFVQFEPRRGEASPLRTEVLVLYDAGHLYVAFRAWDPEPLTAQLTQRDADLFGDDSVMVLLDSYADRQTAYYFQTNVLGTQADGRVGDDGRSSDSNWDAPWQSAARRTDFGWTAEFAIPLTSIKYAAGENRRWGINFGRSRRRTLEYATWAGPLDSQMRVSQAGSLVGLTVAAPARRQQIIPYGLSRAQQGLSPDWQAGIDARYAVTPQTAVYGTVNPDFATIEADQEQVNLTRFEVSLREKRQFFLEGQELFGQRIRTFYSRRIADIVGGGKLLGKQGPWTMAFLSVESDPIADAGRANYSVGRLQHDLFGRSAVAVTFANRNLAGVNQGSVSADTNLLFGKTFNFTGQVVKSWGLFGQGTGAFYVRPSYDSPTGHFHVRYTHLGEHLAENVNAIGFIQDDDRREFDSAAEKTWWVRSGAIEQIQYGSNYNIYWSQKGLLRSWEIDESIDVQFRNRWSTEFQYTEEFKRFEKDFRNRQVGFEVGYNTREYQSVRVGYQFGRNFDSDFQLWTAAANYKVTAALSAEYELQRLYLNPDPEQETTWIHVVRANQFFTKDLFVRLFFQTNSAIDRNNVQAVFVWRYRPPFGTFQVAYQRGTAAFGQRSG
ncbi:MAG: DUF5916 domain-containing protein, partial [Bacteroidales bacterium]